MTHLRQSLVACALLVLALALLGAGTARADTTTPAINTGDIKVTTTSASVGFNVEPRELPGYNGGAYLASVEVGPNAGPQTVFRTVAEQRHEWPAGMGAFMSFSGLEPGSRYLLRVVISYNDGALDVVGDERAFTTLEVSLPSQPFLPPPLPPAPPTPQPPVPPVPQPPTPPTPPTPTPDPTMPEPLPLPVQNPISASDPDCRTPVVDPLRAEAVPGERVELSGSGLGRAGEVRVAGRLALTPEWSPERVVIVIPEGIAPGEVDVALRCGGDIYRTVELKLRVRARPLMAPTANATATPRSRDARSFALDGRASVDPDGQIVRYQWSRAGKVISTDDHFASSFPARARPYEVRVLLTVWDDDGLSATHELVLTVGKVGPTVTRVTLPVALFAFDRAQVRPSQRRALARVRQLVAGADLLQLTGRTDRIGSRAYNRRLSRRRAEQVRGFLVAGLSANQRPRRVSIRAFGEEHPLPGISQRTARGRALQRNVQLLIVRQPARSAGPTIPKTS